MKSFKNGAMLIASMSVFSLIACNSKSEEIVPISQSEAREYLKDADTEEAKNSIIMDETFTWQTTVTGKGMTPGEEGGGKYGAVQYLLYYLTTEGEGGFEDYLLKDFKDLNGQYLSFFNIGESVDRGIAFINQMFFDQLLKWDGCKNFEFGLKGDLLHITFDRTDADTELTFKQEIDILKTGFVDHYTLMFDKINLDITLTDESGGFYVKANGTLTGQVTHTARLTKMPE